MTIPTETNHKLIGLAAAGASMLGLTLEEALALPPAYLTARTANLPTAPAANLTPEARAAAHRDSYQRPQPADATADDAEPDFSILGSIHNN